MAYSVSLVFNLSGDVYRTEPERGRVRTHDSCNETFQAEMPALLSPISKGGRVSDLIIDRVLQGIHFGSVAIDHPCHPGIFVPSAGRIDLEWRPPIADGEIGVSCVGIPDPTCEFSDTADHKIAEKRLKSA